MKKCFCLVVLTIIGAWVFAQESIAVFPFEDMENVLTRNEMVFFYRQFSNEFTNRSGDRFSVVPRQEVDRLINIEEAFQLSVFSAREKTAEMNRVLNGTQILSGIIGKMGNGIAISVSLYTYPNLRQLPGGVDLRVTNKDELFSKIPELVRNMQNEIAGGGINTGRTGVNSAAFTANFVLVEGGTFNMGSSIVGETPQHPVTVSSFYMSKYEVTRKNWQEVMGRRSVPTGDNLPVNVTWYDAVEYCNKLSLKEGLTPCYRGSGDDITCDWNANGYRLPTEAEWEYAAKGGNKDYLIYTYSGSNNPAVVAWYVDNSFKEIQPVGTNQPNSLGIYDMSGNVAEWCWDWFGNYTSTAQINPRGPDSTDINRNRIIRGGSVRDSRRAITSTSRGFLNPWWRSCSGIRVVRVIPAASSR
jgi:formylglycine-generating enzyme required for sulfatase activity